MKITKTFSPAKITSKNKRDKGEIQSVQLWIPDFEASNVQEFPPALIPANAVEKLQWLREQIIGNSVECLTPFGKRLVYYADHTASGRSLLFIEKYILQHLLPVYGNTHTDDSFVGQRTTQLVEASSNYVKRCMKGTDKEAIIFCGTGSTAAIKRLQETMGVAISPLLREQTLGTIVEEKRWVVFVGPYEHHSNLLSWRQSLAEVVEIPFSKEGFIDLEILRTELQNPKYADRPKLGSFSACSNVTGIVTATRTISRLCHAHDCFACFDFAASGPYVDIDMRSGQPDGYDAVFISPHKFMGGPGTSGVLLMTKKLYLIGTRPPSTCGGGTVDFVNLNEPETLYLADIEKREDAGTPGTIQKVRTALTFWVKELIGTDLIESRETLLIETAMSRLSCNPNILIHGGTRAKRIAIMSFNVYTTLRRGGEGGLSGYRSPPDIEGRGSPLRLFMKGGKRDPVSAVRPINGTGTRPVNQFLSLKKEHAGPQGKPLHGRFITKLLNDLFGIQGRGGCSCAGPYAHALLGISDELSLIIRDSIVKGWGSVMPGWARVSFPYYTTTEEFEFLIAAIEFIADYGQRFLQMYDFDWKTGDWTFREEYRELVDEAERYISSKDSKHWWSSSDAPAPRCFSMHPLSSQALATKFTPNLVNYLQIAECIAESLPEQPAVREVPTHIEPNRITFRV